MVNVSDSVPDSAPPLWQKAATDVKSGCSCILIEHDLQKLSGASVVTGHSPPALDLE